MANKSISMTQVRRIIQLKVDGLSKLKIAQSLHIHRATLDNYLLKLLASEKSFPELLEFSDDQLKALVYHDPDIPRADSRIEELRKHLDYFKEELTRPGVTRKVLWEEYHQAYPEGYLYTQFCEHFARHIKCTKGFQLNGFTNHYPDFIVKMKNGKIILIETKGDHLDGSDSLQKLRLGEKWASKAGDKYRCFMVFNSAKLDGAKSIGELIDILKGMK